MNVSASIPTGTPSDPGIAGGQKIYRCGTLTYTKVGLFGLFAWLLWGDFCFTLMEAVVPSVMPLKLKALGCSNSIMALIMTAAPGVMSMTVNPYVSFKSDRYRSRWGRRIPFIIWTMPFVCGTLAIMGFSDDLCVLLRNNSELLSSYSPATITIGLIALFMIMFEFFNMFVNAVFWYLFNDVVPPQFLARFMGAFRIVSTGASAIYNCFVFKYAGTHMREIFVGAALLYLVGFGIACLMIKEGEYPPLDEKRIEEGKGLQGVKTFFKESFMEKFYRYRFFATAFSYAGWSINTFNIFFNRNMGLNLEQIGYISAIGSIAMMAAMYLMAIFVDRWHPLRITVYGSVFAVLGSLGSCVWLFVTMPGNYFFWLNIGNVMIGTFLSALVSVSASPSQMRTFPQSRYGQFCSAQAMLRSVFTIIAGFMAGLFIDFVKYLCGGSDYAYRFIHIWVAFFTAIGAIFLILMYREWYRLGGDKKFHPPAPWNPAGVEELPVVPIIGPQTRWMNLGLRLFDGITGLSALGMPIMMWWLYSRQAAFAFKWYGMAALPLSVLVLLFWIIIRRSICRDMAAARNGLPLRNGIPHHGMLILLGSKYLLAIVVWVCQAVCCIILNLQSGAVVFGIANVLTNLILIGLLYMMCRIERGYSITIDEKQEPALTPACKAG